MDCHAIYRIKIFLLQSQFLRDTFNKGLIIDVFIMTLTVIFVGVSLIKNILTISSINIFQIKKLKINKLKKF